METEPDHKVIDFGNGVVRDTTLSYIIERAEDDPDAELYDYGDANAPKVTT